VTRYARRGALWITINEPTEYISRETKYRGLNIFQQAFMTGNLIKAHRRAYDMIHQLDPGALVSSNLAYQPPPLQLIADAQFFDHVKDKLDFIGLDYYYGLSLDNWSVAKALNGDIWDIKSQPDGLYYAMKSYHSKIPKLPFYIVESGMPSNNGFRSDGYTRSSHLLDHIYWLQRAAADGISVIGYNYWSITDNYEWGTYQPRFGLYTVDVLNDPTLTRTATDAVATYKQIIANNGVPAGYTPVMPASLCNLAAGFSACLGQIISLVTTRSAEDIPITDSDSPVGAGGVAGIVLGMIAGVGLVAAAAVFVVRRRRSSAKKTAGEGDWSSRNSAVFSPEVSSENPKFEEVKV
jgi:beta-glucosidase